MIANILILEDDSDFAGLLVDSLQAAGHSAIVRTTASEALAQLEEAGADLLVADNIIKKNGGPVPEGGIIMTRKAKRFAEKHGRSLPVIAISGAGNVGPGFDFLQVAKDVGADAILSKPFAPAELLSAIDELLASAK